MTKQSEPNYVEDMLHRSDSSIQVRKASQNGIVVLFSISMQKIIQIRAKEQYGN